MTCPSADSMGLSSHSSTMPVVIAVRMPVVIAVLHLSENEVRVRVIDDGSSNPCDVSCATKFRMWLPCLSIFGMDVIC